MAVRQINVERFSVISTKQFSDVVSSIEAQVGHPDIRKFLSEVSSAIDEDELKRTVDAAVGPTNLLEFARFDQGEVLRKETGEAGPQMLRLLIGNPLTMRKMAKHVHDAGSYAPVTILIDERTDGVHISYDRMTSFLAPYGESAATEVARELDATVESVLTKAAT
ncbi:MAG TPA: DUF302 domain-containing protein [Pyrinomonadaceae bacterium]|jgi:uncharacterized protein (DUF302 family)